MDHYMTFADVPKNHQYTVALLIKKAAFSKPNIVETYINRFKELDIDPKDVIAFPLDYDNKRVSVSTCKKTLSRLMPVINSLGITVLYVADGNYFKTLTGVSQAAPHLGSVLPCKGYDQCVAILSYNWGILFHNPSYEAKIALANTALTNYLSGKPSTLGQNIIHSSAYLYEPSEIKGYLEGLHQYPELYADIEAYSLRHYEAGVATIGFSWDKHNGIVIVCDARECEPYEYEVWDKQSKKFKKHVGYHKLVPNLEVRELLKEFFTVYKGKLVWHNANYDIRTIIYTLWMDDISDQVGLLVGREVMTKDIDDTKIISFLATNSCAGNQLSLKEQAFSFAGNYAVDVTDIRTVPLPELTEYNLIDCLCTAYVKEKNYPIMVRDQQEETYLGILMDSIKNLVHVELTGMPVCPEKVQEAEVKMQALYDSYLSALETSDVIKQVALELSEVYTQEDFSKRKEKSKNPDKTKVIQRETPFKPNSGKQLIHLLYTYMGLPVLDTTATGLPATGAKEMKRLLAHTDNPEYKTVINTLIKLNEVYKCLSVFIPVLKEAKKGKDGLHYIFGNFNLGATVSGRMSSNNPNLQNMPSKGEYGKLIKSCFKGDKDWVFSFADFASLEERVNTLLTKDPNKVVVYSRGFDGHSFRTVRYWPDKFQNVDKDCPEQVNCIGETPEGAAARQASKGITFALQFFGTPYTLKKNGGFSEEESQRIYDNACETYAVSMEWVEDKLSEAANCGYGTGAFGLRIRCPVMASSLWGSDKVTREARAEARTLGNAISGQSYGLLNNRAMNAFMERVYTSPYKYDVKPCAMIHDAVYFMLRNDLRVIQWVNSNLIECMEWNELPELQHPEVALAANLELCLSWDKSVELPNNASMTEIADICRNFKAKVSNVN